MADLVRFRDRERAATGETAGGRTGLVGVLGRRRRRKERGIIINGGVGGFLNEARGGTHCPRSGDFFLYMAVFIS
jgi:hypothetical protein